MNRKGVCYDVGRLMMGQNWRPNFDPKIVHRELEIIKKDLHCNAVRINGLDVERLVSASEDALSQGLEVWFSPEMWDKSQEETLHYLAEAASAAEKLRQKWQGKIIFSVGSELTLFMQGIIEGDNFFEQDGRKSSSECRANSFGSATRQPENAQGVPIGLSQPESPTGATRSRGQFAESILPRSPMPDKNRTA